MSESNIRRDVLANGVRFVTERMPHVRSVSIGVWLGRGSRHEPESHSGIAHFVEHMLFKGTSRRTAEGMAQEVDSIGGQLDAFTSKEYAGYYVKVLDEHVPVAVDLLADLVSHPTFDPGISRRSRRSSSKKSRWSRTHRTTWCTSSSPRASGRTIRWAGPILGIPSTVSALDQAALRSYFTETYVAPNMSVVAVGNLNHDELKALVEAALVDVPRHGEKAVLHAPVIAQNTLVRRKELEQSHICLGTGRCPRTIRIATPAMP